MGMGAALDLRPFMQRNPFVLQARCLLALLSMKLEPNPWSTQQPVPGTPHAVTSSSARICLVSACAIAVT